MHLNKIPIGTVGLKNNMNYTPIIGLEIHVELNTKSKMFCGCKNNPFHAENPNIHTCPVCLGLPGGLPVANKKAIESTIALGLALGCEIPLFTKFDRKNYFYPDLPKGYQISQYDQPMCIKGKLSTSFGDVGITRVHLEEDTAKLLHQTVDEKKVSLIDFNRSGVPLVEIVTEPDIHSSEQAREFLKKLHQIIRYLNISEAEMSQGSMRLEPNISLSAPELVGKELPNYKVEVKNINSFNFAKKAIDFELERHEKLLDKGETPPQETRGWDEKRNSTYSQRKKETAADYRYFPDPDLPPMHWEQKYINELKSQLEELPDAKVARFMQQYELPEADAIRLTETKEMADMFDCGLKDFGAKLTNAKLAVKDVANWIVNKKIDMQTVQFDKIVTDVIAAKVKVAIDPAVLEKAISSVITANEKAAADYKAGKVGVIMFLVGQVMKELKGKADATQVKKLLEEKLK